MSVERKKGRANVNTVKKCSYCGGTYDLGPPTWVGEPGNSYHWWPDGNAAWLKHCVEAHSDPTVDRGSSPRVGQCRSVCVWLCSVCGQRRQYRISGTKHAGPADRLLDLRYGLAYCEGSTYPKHKRAFGRMDGARGPVVFYHEGAPNPSQPEQTDPSLAGFLADAESDGKPTRKRRSGTSRGKKAGAGGEREDAERGVLVQRRREVRPGNGDDPAPES